MSAEWWDESRRGALLGYGFRTGHVWTHLTRIRDEGPGAVRWVTACGGMAPITVIAPRVVLYSDEAVSRAWKDAMVDTPVVGPVAFMRPWHCPKCVGIVERATARARAGQTPEK